MSAWLLCVTISMHCICVYACVCAYVGCVCFNIRLVITSSWIMCVNPGCHLMVSLGIDQSCASTGVLQASQRYPSALRAERALVSVLLC